MLSKPIIPLSLLAVCSVVLLAGCAGAPAAAPLESGGGAGSSAPAPVAFDADTCYGYVARQVSFGPRVPGTSAGRACGEWLVGELRRHGALVTVHDTTGTDCMGKPLPVRNIMGSYLPGKANRVLLCAHYDSRPWADHDADAGRRDQPIDGANDGASGVAVLLELARQMSATPPPIGVDLLLFDAEDGGQPDHRDMPYRADTWCVGSQLWSASAAGREARHRYGILLDMVGDAGAVFPRELFSKSQAGDVLDQVWRTAQRLGLHGRFIDDDGGYITDDHLYVARLTGVPMIDIIDYRGGSFCPTWHTHHDDLGHIDRATLADVGRVVLTVVMGER